MEQAKNHSLRQSKLIKLLEKLPPKDISAFRKYLQSPFFNHRKDVLQLFECLEKHLKSLNTLPYKEVIFSQIYPAQPYRDQNFRLLMSYLFKNLEHFLVFKDITQNDLLIKTKLATTYRQLGLPELAQKEIKQVETELAARPLRNVTYFNDLLRIQKEKYRFISTDQPTGKLNLQEISDTIDISYLALKLREMCFLLSHQSVYQLQYDVGFLNEVLKYVEQAQYLKTPAIGIYYHCYRMLKEGAEGQFSHFKKGLFEHGEKFPADEIRDLYLFGINFCIRQLNDGNMEYFKEVLDLYQEGLKKEYLLENGVLSRFTYHNIVAAGLHTKEFEWVDFFINHYKYALEKKYRESSFSFNLARLEYNRKNYDIALELLQKSNYRDLLLNLAAKTVLLKIYYQMDETDLLDSHLDAMKNYLRRKRVIGYHKTNYQNIIRYARKLVRLNPFDKKARKTLAEQIRGEEVLTEREWFLAQLF